MKCSVISCQNTIRRRPIGVSFHRFPKNEDMMSLWLHAIGRIGMKVKNCTVVCSEHFYAKDLIATCKKRMLFKDAVPALKLEPILSVEMIPPFRTNEAMLPIKNVLDNGKEHILSTEISQMPGMNNDLLEADEWNGPFVVISSNEPQVESLSQTNAEGLERILSTDFSQMPGTSNVLFEANEESGPFVMISSNEPQIESLSQTNAEGLQRLKPVELNAFVPKRARLECDEAHDVQSPIEAISIACYEAVSNLPKTNTIGALPLTTLAMASPPALLLMIQ